MSKITNRLAFFAKIQRRSAELTKTAEEWAEIWRKEGRADASGSIPPENIDRQNFPEKREPYATERYSAEISNSVNFLNPAMQNIVTDEHVKVRAQKVAAGHLGGESKWFINEVMVENHYVRGYSLMIGGWTGKGSVTRKVDGDINDGPYEYGTEVQVEFVPNAGYRFVSWSDGGQNPHTVTMNDDVILEVVAEQIPVYTLAFSAAGVGTVAATVNETAVLSPAQVEAGASVAITATASAGHLFSEWIGYPEGAVISGNIVSFTMPSSAVSITANFIEAPSFQGLKLTNTAVSEYITGLTEAPTAQLQFSEMYDEPGLPYPYYWCDDDYDAFTATRHPGIGDTISGSSETEVSAGTVTAYISTPISNVLHFQPGTDTGFQSLQYSTDASEWNDWPMVAGELNVMALDVNDGTNDFVIAFDDYSEAQSWYTWSIYVAGGGDESSWHSATRNVAVGDVLEFVSSTAASANVTVTGLHYTNSLVLSPGSGIPTYAYDLPRSMSDGTMEWYSSSGSVDYIVTQRADPGLLETVEFHPEGGSPTTTTLASVAPDSSVTCAAYPSTTCHYVGFREGLYNWADGFPQFTLIIGTTSRWPSVEGTCNWMTESEIGSSTLTDVTITPPSDYGTVTFSDDLYLKGVSECWATSSSMSKLWTDGTVNASGRASSVITGTDQPADFSGVSAALAYIFGDYDDVGQFVRVVDASGLVLDDTLGLESYGGMFNMNTTLTIPPALPATTLTESCYAWMFTCCESLTTAPVLPALNLTEGCYQGMFAGCSSLNEITCLATDITATSCTAGWLIDVAEEGTFHRNPDTWAGWTTGDSGIPSGWEVDPPAPADTRLKITVTGGTGKIKLHCGTADNRVCMVSSDDGANWSNIGTYSTTPFTFNDTILVKASSDSFGGDINGNWYFDFTGTTGTLAVSGDITCLVNDGVGGVLDISGLNSYYFAHLFSSCSQITDFSGLLLPSTTLSTGCYYQMFFECTGLTSAPTLPAPILVESCYQYMFYACNNLHEVHCSATDISASNCTTDYLGDTSTSGDFYGKTAANWPMGTQSGIPLNWTAHLD